ncbi:MAG: cytochrome c [Vicinamibacterales bacterium]
MRLVTGLSSFGALLVVALVAVPGGGPALEARTGGQAAGQPQEPAQEASQAATMSGDVAHGQYLVEHVAMCIECHSGRDPQGNIIPDERFMGNFLPVQKPWPNTDWALRAPRIHGLPGYTEEQGVRLLTKGAIDRNGVQLRLPMPRFRMTREDALAVVHYLKSLPAVP